MGFAENLKKKREELGLTQMELAEKTGIKQPMITQYEKGMKLPTIVTGVELEDVLGISCRELVKGEEQT